MTQHGPIITTSGTGSSSTAYNTFTNYNPSSSYSPPSSFSYTPSTVFNVGSSGGGGGGVVSSVPSHYTGNTAQQLMYGPPVFAGIEGSVSSVSGAPRVGPTVENLTSLLAARQSAADSVKVTFDPAASPTSLSSVPGSVDPTSGGQANVSYGQPSLGYIDALTKGNAVPVPGSLPTSLYPPVGDATGVSPAVNLYRGQSPAQAYNEGFSEGLSGGLSITANSLSRGATDKLGLTDSTKYQGAAYDDSRVFADFGTAFGTAAALGMAGRAYGSTKPDALSPDGTLAKDVASIAAGSSLVFDTFAPYGAATRYNTPTGLWRAPGFDELTPSEAARRNLQSSAVPPPPSPSPGFTYNAPAPNFPSYVNPNDPYAAQNQAQLISEVGGNVPALPPGRTDTIVPYNTGEGTLRDLASFPQGGGNPVTNPLNIAPVVGGATAVAGTAGLMGAGVALIPPASAGIGPAPVAAMAGGATLKTLGTTAAVVGTAVGVPLVFEGSREALSNITNPGGDHSRITPYFNDRPLVVPGAQGSLPSSDGTISPAAFSLFKNPKDGKLIANEDVGSPIDTVLIKEQILFTDAQEGVKLEKLTPRQAQQVRAARQAALDELDEVLPQIEVVRKGLSPNARLSEEDVKSLSPYIERINRAAKEYHEAFKSGATPASSEAKMARQIEDTQIVFPGVDQDNVTTRQLDALDKVAKSVEKSVPQDGGAATVRLYSPDGILDAPERAAFSASLKRNGISEEEGFFGPGDYLDINKSSEFTAEEIASSGLSSGPVLDESSRKVQHFIKFQVEKAKTEYKARTKEDMPRSLEAEVQTYVRDQLLSNNQFDKISRLRLERQATANRINDVSAYNGAGTIAAGPGQITYDDYQASVSANPAIGQMETTVQNMEKILAAESDASTLRTRINGMQNALAQETDPAVRTEIERRISSAQAELSNYEASVTFRKGRIERIKNDLQVARESAGLNSTVVMTNEQYVNMRKSDPVLSNLTAEYETARQALATEKKLSSPNRQKIALLESQVDRLASEIQVAERNFAVGKVITAPVGGAGNVQLKTYEDKINNMNAEIAKFSDEASRDALAVKGQAEVLLNDYKREVSAIDERYQNGLIKDRSDWLRQRSEAASSFEAKLTLVNNQISKIATNTYEGGWFGLQEYDAYGKKVKTDIKETLGALALGLGIILPLYQELYSRPNELEESFERQKELMALQFEYWKQQLALETAASGGGGGGGGESGEGSGTTSGNTSFTLASA